MADIDDLLKRIDALQGHFDRLGIDGGFCIQVDGNPRVGYAVNDICDDDAEEGVQQPSPSQIGACCFLDGTCHDHISQQACSDSGGTWQGPASACVGGLCPIFGCTDPAANNFDPSATSDDGSCEYDFGACCFEGSCFIDTLLGCSSYGMYQGDNTDCSGDRCVTPVGACCHGDGSCTIESEASCSGDYRGDGTICGDITCPVTPCPSLHLVCDRICGTSFKCGERNPADGQYYRTHIFGFHSTGGRTSHTDACLVEEGPPPVYEPLNWTELWDVFRLTTRTWTFAGGACLHSDFLTCGGFSSYSGDNPNCRECGDVGSCDYTNCTIFDVGAGPPPCSWAADEPCIFIVLPAGCRDIPCVYSNRGGTPQFNVSEYEDIITLDDLKTQTEGVLETYDNDFNDACAASTNLSADQRTYSICRFRYKFQFTPIANDILISWFETGPDGSVARAEVVPAGGSETSVNQCDEPTNNGVTIITSVTCDVL